MSKIFFVMGKSCSGKDTIFQYLKKYAGLKLKTVVGYTTRPKREGEVDGVEYFFVDKKNLGELREAGKIIECRDYDTVKGRWSYFTVDDGQIDLKNDNYIYIGTLDSYKMMSQYYGRDIVIPIYIQVEPGERLERALQREKSQSDPQYAEMCRRFIADEEDFKEENIISAGITTRYNNKNLDDCISEIRKTIQNQG